MSWYEKVNQGSNHLNAQIRLAVILDYQGQLDKAIEHLHNVSVDNNEDKLSLAQVEVELLIEHKRYDEVMIVYNQALKANSNNINLLFSRAILADQMGNLKQFEQDLRHILEINP